MRSQIVFDVELREIEYARFITLAAKSVTRLSRGSQLCVELVDERLNGIGSRAIEVKLLAGVLIMYVDDHGLGMLLYVRHLGLFPSYSLVPETWPFLPDSGTKFFNDVGPPVEV